ncbi:type I-B CRISPR-associated protein Cas7/Cst2/DevR [Leptotrichia sp. oral taxon 417]|jgi:CRISPR-associated regulatory protein, DevR family|uniref:type I-B CRISPR-associated protein Cas7/Cst2/DevR n=1 Tax=Leptotrichia sp. oral taxon 417 TaxID=712365 RepID=UPI0015BC2C81|nr:type I-B CRISPR-associated protein Cas7/Cst2/DevR [Leptotrichia sp. oral taxon 417]NWO27106.1 type I-B CRISPR-associated protein Cas7/Cst2/DevR [Leptotrichia sp. oral taxon 417]
MDKKGLTFTAIFLAESANYGEGIGNVATLKKISRNRGEQYTYISRQAIRYNIVEQLGENKANVKAEGSGDKKVVQFSAETTIKDYPELDFFGYMKTVKGDNSKNRSAIVRLSNAVSLETFKGDLEFLTNKGLVDRIDRNEKVFPNIAQAEIHKSYYKYTVTIDLDKIGIDELDEIEIKKEEKARRVNKLLDTISLLYRDIRGRREDLKPLFIIGGVYDIKNPFFENVVDVRNNKILVEKLTSGIYDFIENDTAIGIVKEQFENDTEIETELAKRNIKVLNVPEFFKQLKNKIGEYYTK